MAWNSCCVRGCGVTVKSIPRRTFHSLPCDIEKCKSWLQIIQREDLLQSNLLEIYKKYRLCSDHFSDSQFSTTLDGKGRRLRKFAIPDIIPGISSQIDFVQPIDYDCAKPSESQNVCEQAPPDLHFPSSMVYPKNSDTRTQIYSDLDIALETVIQHSGEKFLDDVPQMPEKLLHDMFMPRKIQPPEVLEKVKQKLCRVCGNNEFGLIPIIEDLTIFKMFNIPLIRMMQMYLPVKVDMNDPYPSNICVICLCILKQWHKLYTTCIAADKVFKNTFCQEKHNEEKDVQQYSNGIGEGELILIDLPSEDHDYIRKQKEIQEIKQDILLEKYPDVSANEVGEISVNKQSISSHLKKKKRRVEVLKSGGNSSVRNEVSVNEQQSALLLEKEDKKKMQCKNCWETFIKKNEFIEHIRACKSGPIVCEKCGKIFGSKSAYHHHKYLYHRGIMRMCEKCGKCLPLSKYRNHANSEHPETQCCELCCIILRSRKEYNAHMRRHVKGLVKRIFEIEPIIQDEKTIFQCPVCAQSFDEKTTLIQHLNALKIVKCPKCHVRIRNERGFILHKCKAAVNCRFCSKTFQYKALLSAHERIHTGEKPFRCQCCSKYFRTQHLRIQHQKIHFAPTYKCAICSKMFKRPTALRVHEKTHSDKQCQ